jgi:prepilin-type N-terminal cleavage/methylation domain-containing protein
LKDKLRAYLSKPKGFTLVELLVVIAIIAILVLLVIIAINPIERIRDANDERANSAVRATVTAVTACAVKELSEDANADIPALCGTWALLVTGNYVQGTEPANLTWVGPLGGDTVCVFSPGGHGAPDNAGGDNQRSQIVEVTDAGSAIGAATPCPVP